MICRSIAAIVLLIPAQGQLHSLPRGEMSYEQAAATVQKLFAGARESSVSNAGTISPEAREKLAAQLNQALSTVRPDQLERIASLVLTEGAKLNQPFRETSYRVQQVVADGLLNSYLSAVKARGDLPAAFARVDRFEKVAVENGVPPSQSAVVRLNIISRLWSAGLLDDPDRQLSLCVDVAADDSVWPEFRAGYWNLRAVVSASQGHFAESYECYDRALKLYRELGNELLVANVRMNVAELAISLGDYAGANRELSAAKEIFLRASMDQRLNGALRSAVAINRLVTEIQLAREMRLEGRAGPALDLLRQIQQSIVEEEAAQPTDASGNTGQHFTPIHAFALSEKGMCLYSLGRFADAQQNWQQARDLYVDGSQDRALIEANLGWCALSTNDLKDAAQHFTTALSRIAQGRQPEARCYLARVLSKQGDFQQARQQLHQALDVSEAEINNTLRTALSERDRQAYLLKLRSHTEQATWPGVFDTYLELAPQLGIGAEEQYRRVLRWKGVLSQYSSIGPSGEGMGGRRGLVAKREALVKTVRAMAVAVRHLEQQATLSPSESEQLDQLREKVRSNEREIGGIEREIRRIDAASGTAQQQQLLDVADVASILSERSALLDILVTSSFRPPDGKLSGPRQRTIGFLIDHSGKVGRVELGDADPIALATQQFTEAITSQRSIAEGREQLDSLIGRPIQQQLPPVDLLYVSGDGWVHRVPLGALSGATHPFWIEELAFAQVASAHSLIRRQHDSLAASGALLVGGLDYGPGRGRVWPYLLGTWLESQQVQTQLQQRYPEMDIEWLLARQCDKETLSEGLRKRRIVHLATHGFFEDRESELGGIYDISAQMDSGLVLSNANLDLTAGAEYVLTAEELGREDLSGVELLVLSACNTGLGHLSHGEGIIGLLGALDRAGVRTVVSALWEVDDAATMKLMEAFYRHCLDEDLVHPAQAMRRAQINMLHGEIDVSNRVAEELQRPYFWAAWSVMGWSG